VRLEKSNVPYFRSLHFLVAAVLPNVGLPVHDDLIFGQPVGPPRSQHNAKADNLLKLGHASIKLNNVPSGKIFIYVTEVVIKLLVHTSNYRDRREREIFFVFVKPRTFLR
jgi:hypothetical protein